MSRGRSVLIVQPPFVQLNAPYPASYYLRSFLESTEVRCRVADHSIGLFERIFSRGGLTRVFTEARPRIEARLDAPCGGPDEEPTRLNLARYLAQADRWIASIDRTVAFLRGTDREFAHLLAAANGVLPAGARALALVDGADGSPGTEDAPLIASAMLADAADLIQVVLDSGFSLVRYAESLATGIGRFADVESAVDAWVPRTFYEPLLEEEWARVETEWEPTIQTPFILACTIPFPGCLVGALAAARSAKRRFGDRVRTIAGGGYVNTELRSIKTERFFDYFDFLSFDRGYGSLAAVLDLGAARPPRPLHKTMHRSESGAIIGDDISTAVENAPYARIDEETPLRVFPDYRGVDFSRYIMPVDDANPMHRLWSDGRWLKAYLAHGCYWHSCAFCDVSLDYISGFGRVDPDALFDHLIEQAEVTGIRGVHLVDEAAPPESLLRLADRNRRAGLPLVFWGNIRFERDFSPDSAALLAAGGLLGVSGGIEVASERGFKRLGKGLGLKDVVRAAAAFKEAGILVHAYLIFGFWDEDDEEIVDSAETVRQLFASGLIDSAFWHKFVLTRHSRIMREKRAGRHPGLAVIERGAFAADGDFADGDFADNDLRFEGEERTSRWSAPLDAMTAAWMAGDALDLPVSAYTPFKTPPPTIAADLVARQVDAYARDRDKERARFPDAVAADAQQRVLFLGGSPVRERLADGRIRLRWSYRLQDQHLDLPADTADTLFDILQEAGRAGIAVYRLVEPLQRVREQPAAIKIWSLLRENGLVIVH